MRKLIVIVIAIILSACTNVRDKSIFEPLKPKEISQLMDDYGDASFSFPKKDNDTVSIKIIDILFPVFEIIQKNVTAYHKEKYKSITYGQVFDGVKDISKQMTKLSFYNDSINKIIDKDFAIVKARQFNLIDSIIQAYPPQKKYSYSGYNFYANEYLKVSDDPESMPKELYGKKILEERMPQIKFCSYRSELPNYESYGLKGMVDIKKMMNTYNPQIVEFFDAINVPLSPTSIQINALLDKFFKDK